MVHNYSMLYLRAQMVSHFSALFNVSSADVGSPCWTL